MAAAAPRVAHGDGSSRDVWFIVAYLVCRVSAARSWQRTGTILLSWPAAQLGGGLAPWIVSLWIDPPWRYVLWGLGVALDLGFSMFRARHPEQMLDAMKQRLQRRQAQEERRGTPSRQVDVPVPAILDPTHLMERLGLFVIIVLGEAVAQVVAAAATVDWDAGLAVAALAGFGLLVSLWWLIFQYGMAGLPSSEWRMRKPYLLIPAHFVTTVGITATAAGLGAVAHHATAPLPTVLRWVLCGGLAGYFAVSAGLGVVSGAPWRWIFGWGLPSMLSPLVVAGVGWPVPGWGMVVTLLVVTLWRVGYGRGDLLRRATG